MQVTSLAPVPVTADWLPRHEFVLDHPPETVWPLIVRWDQWLTGYRCEHVSGEEDAVGEVMRITAISASGEALGSYLAEVVRFIPGRRLVYRLMHIDNPIDTIDEVHGYAVFNLLDLGGGQTFVTYQTMAELTSTHAGLDEFRTQWDDQATRPDEWLDTYVPELRRLLETRPGT